MQCGAELCENESAQSWQRWLSADELAEYKADGRLRPHVREAAIMVYACEDHMLSPDAMAVTHGATCLAPPTCTCGVV